jgi:hypothetical protein
MSRFDHKLCVNTGDDFWKIMDHILCIKDSFPGEARLEAKKLCQLWEAKKIEVQNLEEALEICQMKDDYR